MWSDVQLFVGTCEPKAELITPVHNEVHVKLRGGFWTSTYHPETRSQWVEFCVSEHFRLDRMPHGWLLQPRQDARIQVIDSLHDLRWLMYEYSHEFEFAPNWKRRYLDFEKLAEKYDGVHLTNEGQWQTRMSEPNLYGWDVESTLWFRWAFEDVTPLGAPVITQKAVEA